MASATYVYDQCGRLLSVQYNDDNSMVIYTYDSLGNRLMTYEIAGGGGDCCPPKFTLSPQNTNFTAEEPGYYYLITGTVTVTMAPCQDIGEGNMMKFKVLSGQATFAFNGSETFNHANGTSDQTLVLSPNSGVLEIVVNETGFDET